MLMNSVLGFLPLFLPVISGKKLLIKHAYLICNILMQLATNLLFKLKLQQGKIVKTIL